MGTCGSPSPMRGELLVSSRRESEIEEADDASSLMDDPHHRRKACLSYQVRLAFSFREDERELVTRHHGVQAIRSVQAQRSRLADAEHRHVRFIRVLFGHVVVQTSSVAGSQRSPALVPAGHVGMPPSGVVPASVGHSAFAHSS